MLERWEVVSLITVGILIVVALAGIVIDLVEANRQRAEEEDEHNGGIW